MTTPLSQLLPNASEAVYAAFLQLRELLASTSSAPRAPSPTEIEQRGREAYRLVEEPVDAELATARAIPAQLLALSATYVGARDAILRDDGRTPLGKTRDDDAARQRLLAGLVRAVTAYNDAKRALLVRRESWSVLDIVVAVPTDAIARRVAVITQMFPELAPADAITWLRRAVRAGAVEDLAVLVWLARGRLREGDFDRYRDELQDLIAAARWRFETVQIVAYRYVANLFAVMDGALAFAANTIAAKGKLDPLEVPLLEQAFARPDDPAPYLAPRDEERAPGAAPTLDELLERIENS